MSDPERLSEADVGSLFEPGWLARCDHCGWPIVPDDKPGCWEGCCSMRPMPSNADTPRKAIVRKLLAERAAIREALAVLATEADVSDQHEELEAAIRAARAMLAPQKAEEPT